MRGPVVPSAGPASWLIARTARAPCGHSVESQSFQVDQMSLPRGLLYKTVLEHRLHGEAELGSALYLAHTP